MNELCLHIDGDDDGVFSSLKLLWMKEWIDNICFRNWFQILFFPFLLPKKKKKKFIEGINGWCYAINEFNAFSKFATPCFFFFHFYDDKFIWPFFDTSLSH